ncbi:MAG: SUMF1/EgtB/PvdO family nonheme iron enzyme [Acidobacteriota bacterium]
MTKLLAFVFTLTVANAADFVLVKGGLLRPGAAMLRLDDFEMLDHPVTNAEYKLFVDEAKYAPPQHWEGGRIPVGMENWPVIFVNRADANAYVTWRSKKEGRVYRLPTASEFEYASRAGSPEAMYPWGNDSPAGKANYDPNRDRAFTEWRRHIQPVKSYPPNGWGLHDMAGNVWQMVDTYPDPATRTFVYRIESPLLHESAVAGGSWARSEYYLRCGVRGGISAGIRHPDLGFRVVREPAGATGFQRQPRRLIAAPAGGGAVYLGWQLLRQDTAATGFHIYRTTRRDTAGERITNEPVSDSTNFVDRQPPAADRTYYRVRAVAAGKEGPPSEWAAVQPGGPRSGLIATFEPTVKQGGFVPVFGDLDGDGVLDAVLRLDNGIRETSRDPGVPVELEAFTNYGRSLWRRPLVRHDHCFGNANNVPVVVHDLDGDRRAEVICRLQEGDKTYLAVLDGMSGRVRRKTPWTAMVSDFSRSSTRVHMSVAYLDGKAPAIVTQTGLYENEILDAYDAGLKKLWTYRSFGETNGSGSHHVDIADVDGDGRDEVFNGTMLLNPDGTLRWALYRAHPDIVAVKHILPGVKDRQVYYAVENSVHAGAYLVDAKTGKVIWKLNREDDPRWVHAHIGWASDIWEGSPGMEMLTNRDGHPAQDQVLFAAAGKILLNPFPPGWRPVNWTGGPVRELMTSNGKQLGRFNGSGVTPVPGSGPNELGGGCGMVADLAGDYRDEVVCSGAAKEGAAALFVFSNIEPARKKEITRTASREYRLWMARNMGGGYASYFEWEP